MILEVSIIHKFKVSVDEPTVNMIKNDEDTVQECVANRYRDKVIKFYGFAKGVGEITARAEEIVDET